MRKDYSNHSTQKFTPHESKVTFLSPSAGLIDDRINRRKFLKRSGGTTAAAIISGHVACMGRAEAAENSVSAKIKLDLANPGDGANPGGAGEKEKHGWNWKSTKLTNIDNQDHLLVVRWKCNPHPKHPSNLVGTKRDRWDFEIQILAQLRKTPINPPDPLPNGGEEYMVYEGKYYSDLVADAGYSTQAGSNGTASVDVTKVSQNNSIQCKLSHNAVDDEEEFYVEQGFRRYKLVLAVRNDKPDGNIATSQNYTAAILASVLKEEPEQAASQFEIKYTPPVSITFTLKPGIPSQDIKTSKLGEVTTSMKLGFTVVDS